MRQNQYRRWQLFGSFLGLWLLAMGSLALPTRAAAGSPTNISNDVVQSYTAGANIENGMIVELKSGSTQTVVPLHNTDLSHALGVIVPGNNAAIVLTPASATGQQVLVANNGRYNVLVTNQGGAIKSGNYITISSVDGVGMAANNSNLEVIGQAAGNFNGTGNVLGTVQLKDKQGHTSSVSVGSVPVNLDIMPNPLFQINPAFVPGFLNQLASGVAGKSLSAGRIYVAMAVLLAMVFIIASILFGSVRGSLIALGRNPLSRQPITRSLMQTMVIVLIIFAIGIFAVYLLLKL